MKEFDKVLGYGDIKAELERVCDVMRDPERYKKLGVTTPRGLLLFGEPGVGKTLMANCLIQASGRRAYTIRKDLPDGEFVNEIKRVFKEAKANAPSIVFLDDIDKFANEDGDHPNAEEYVTVQSCVDGCRGCEVFTLATANDLEGLPDSLLRAGRFDKIIEVRCPDKKDAAGIVGYYLSRKSNVGDIDANEIARILDGNSCAELETVINEAGLIAGYAGRDKIEMSDMVEASLSVLFGADETYETPESLERIACHQAGHAVVAELLESGSITLVTTRGEARDEYGTTVYCRADNYFYEKKYMETRIASLLGGRAATEIVYGEADVCCSDDIARAFAIAERFFDGYCSACFDARREDYGSSGALLNRSEMSTAFEIERLYERARRLLIKNRDFFTRTVNALKGKKTLIAGDLAAIKAECNITTGIDKTARLSYNLTKLKYSGTRR